MRRSRIAATTVDFPLPEGPATRTFAPCASRYTSPRAPAPRSTRRRIETRATLRRSSSSSPSTSSATPPAGGEIHALLQRGERVRRGHAALACVEERVIVLRVADPDRLVERQPE